MPVIIDMPADSPRYCEIDESQENEDGEGGENAHYEYLYKARSATPLHYESVYQEISEDEKNKQKEVAAITTVAATVADQIQPQPLRAIEGLPDIIGNAPSNRGNSSSDADDECGSNPNVHTNIHMISDTFKPASFFLNQSKRSSSEEAKMEKVGRDGDRRGSQSSLLSNRALPMTSTQSRSSAAVSYTHLTLPTIYSV